MSRARVVNVRSELFDVYIGRAVPRSKNPRCRRAGTFANPFRSGTPSETAVYAATVNDALTAYAEHPKPRVYLPTRELAIEAFERWLRGWLVVEPSLQRSLLELDGKQLGCWCAPEPCHGDVLVRLIDIMRRPFAHLEGTPRTSFGARVLGAACSCGGDLRVSHCGKGEWKYEVYCAQCKACDPNGYGTMRDAVLASKWYFAR